VGLSDSPIGAVDGSRGIHPTGWDDTPRLSVAYATVGNLVPKGRGTKFVRGMNSPATIMLSLRDENDISPIGALDGSRGIHPTGSAIRPHSSVAYATVGNVVPTCAGE